jgi:hypothetical protein
MGARWYGSSSGHLKGEEEGWRVSDDVFTEMRTSSCTARSKNKWPKES